MVFIFFKRGVYPILFSFMLSSLFTSSLFFLPLLSAKYIPSPCPAVAPATMYTTYTVYYVHYTHICAILPHPLLSVSPEGIMVVRSGLPQRLSLHPDWDCPASTVGLLVLAPQPPVERCLPLRCLSRLAAAVYDYEQGSCQDTSHSWASAVAIRTTIFS